MPNQMSENQFLDACEVGLREFAQQLGSIKPEPGIEQLMAWESEGGCEATDGCWVEPDGTCEHGCKSWLLELGFI